VSLVLVSSLATMPLAAAAQLAGTKAAITACPPSAKVISPVMAQTLRSRAQDHGVLWRLQKAGVVSYLYGTLHIGKMEWSVPGPQLAQALASSHKLLLELDPFNPNAPSSGVPLPARTAKPLYIALDPSWQGKLNHLAAKACIPQEPLGKMNVSSRLRTFSYAVAQADGLHRVYSQERMLSLFARQRKMPLFALESAASQNAAFQPPSAAAAKRMIDNTLTQLQDGTLRAVTQRMARSWAAGDLADLAAYEAWCACATHPEDRAFLRQINDQRNVHLANSIVALHQDKKPFLAAFGTLHMTGPNGLPTLLEKQGFVVQRVAFAKQ
jgi:uncharacterized protein YbaP (TraB family)